MASCPENCFNEEPTNEVDSQATEDNELFLDKDLLLSEAELKDPDLMRYAQARDEVSHSEQLILQDEEAKQQRIADSLKRLRKGK